MELNRFWSFVVALTALFVAPPVHADGASLLDGKKTVFLGDSITQAGTYVSFTDYYLERLYPMSDFDVYPLGLGSETLSGLSEAGHAGGAFPRPCLFERLGRVLEKVKPDVVFACYGMNDGIYLPLEEQRFAAFKTGVQTLIRGCKAGGVQQIFLITPPIYDVTTKPDEFNYDSVLTAYAAWEMTLSEPGVTVIDLHSALRTAREQRTEAFSKDGVHPGDDGHLAIARALLHGLGVSVPDESLEQIHKDPLYQEVDKMRKRRGAEWMKHTGYTREKTVEPEPLGAGEKEAAEIQKRINKLRRPN